MTSNRVSLICILDSISKKWLDANIPSIESLFDGVKMLFWGVLKIIVCSPVYMNPIIVDE